jgi:hypothetical protein
LKAALSVFRFPFSGDSTAGAERIDRIPDRCGGHDSRSAVTVERVVLAAWRKRKKRENGKPAAD